MWQQQGICSYFFVNEDIMKVYPQRSSLYVWFNIIFDYYLIRSIGHFDRFLLGNNTFLSSIMCLVWETKMGSLGVGMRFFEVGLVRSHINKWKKKVCTLYLSFHLCNVSCVVDMGGTCMLFTPLFGFSKGNIYRAKNPFAKGIFWANTHI